MMTVTYDGEGPPYALDPPGRPRPDVVCGAVIFYPSLEAEMGSPRAGILVELLRRTEHHGIEVVDSTRTQEAQGRGPTFRFEIRRPGEYAVRVKPDQPALEGYRPPPPREVVSFTCGVTMQMELGVLPRP